MERYRSLANKLSLIISDHFVELFTIPTITVLMGLCASLISRMKSRLKSKFFKFNRCYIFIFSLENYWLKQVRENAPPNAVIFLVGNKADLENERQVSPSPYKLEIMSFLLTKL